MGTVRTIPREIKDQILARIKNEGVPAATAAKEHGISPKTVYNWLSRGINGSPSLLEMSRLRRENQELLEIIGRLTHELKKTKKNQPGQR